MIVMAYIPANSGADNPASYWFPWHSNMPMEAITGTSQ